MDEQTWDAMKPHSYGVRGFSGESQFTPSISCATPSSSYAAMVTLQRSKKVCSKVGPFTSLHIPPLHLHSHFFFTLSIAPQSNRHMDLDLLTMTCGLSGADVSSGPRYRRGDLGLAKHILLFSLFSFSLSSPFPSPFFIVVPADGQSAAEPTHDSLCFLFAT